MDNKHYFCFGGHNVCITFAESGVNSISLLPSFAPFRIDDELENLLFTLYVDDTLRPEKKRSLVRKFDTGNGDTLVYQLPDGGEGAVIISYTGTSSEMVIPETLDDHPVVAIGDQAFNFLTIETATLPATVKHIGNMAFYQCASLKQVLIQDGVTSIGTCCFGGDPLLAEVTIPETVETVDDFAFLACASLKEVTFGPALKKIGTSAFQMCATLSRVTLPESAEIGENAFTDCSPDLEIVKQ